jgi:hypothetical protein
MSRVRPFLLILLSVFAVSAAYAASASAHTIIIEGKEIAKGEHIAAEGVSKGSRLYADEYTTECKKSSSVDEFEAEGKAKGEVTSSECKILQDSGCKFEEPIHAKIKTELVVFKEKLASKMTPQTGEVLSKTTLSGCNHSDIDGKWNVEGSQINELPEAETEKVEHEYVTTPAGSSLWVTGAEEFRAEAEGSGITKLVSKKKWSMK